MGSSRVVETVVGLFIIVGIASLFFLAMQVSNLGSLNADDGFVIKARFDNISGLKVRSPVSVSGVTIGRVKAIYYDTDVYRAVVEMLIEPRYTSLPLDTTASIFTAGLLGEKYIGLDPGGDEEYLKDGDMIEFTQPALVLEEVVGKFLFSKAQGD